MTLEVLAPAGNREALEAAAAAGADAVYLGYSAFSARAGAGNFDEEQLRDAIRFAHLHHIRVHVAVNILIKDQEMDDAMQVLDLLRRLGADAVLVQDLGLLRQARAVYPDLALHASTQMSLHNRTGVRWCREMGMKQVVLARECSLKEIALCRGEGIRIEAFGHGAQCVGVSGQCLFSSMIGNRSGNRGRCAQPCRLIYEYRGRKGAWLSPRDVCQRDRMDQLAEAGVVSVKLEGRLKRPEYVSVITDAYRRGADGVESGHFTPADRDEMQGLLQIFSRGGFMQGYAFGAEDADVIDPKRVSHSGVEIGMVTGLKNGFARVLVQEEIHNGDGLQLRTVGGDEEMVYSGPETPRGGTALIRLRSGSAVKTGDHVFRLTDSRQLEIARARKLKPIPCTMVLKAMPGQPLALTLTDGVSFVTVTGDAVQPAQNRSLSEADAVRSLGKTGDTPFAAGEIRVETEQAFVPVSALNELRRRGLAALSEKRIAAFGPDNGDRHAVPETVLPEEHAPEMLIFRTKEQLERYSEPYDLAVWAPEDWRTESLERELAALPEGIWLQLPTVCEEGTLQQLRCFAEEHRDRLGGLLLGSVGQLGVSWPLPYGAGTGIPVMNRYAAALLLEQGCRFVTASPELDGKELAVLTEGDPPIAVPAYGRTRLMILHHCPARTLQGFANGHASCTLCDRYDERSLAGTVLTDRMHAEFPLLRQRLPEGCRIELYNSLPTNVRSRVKHMGLSGVTVLTDEDGSMNHAMSATAGHWNRTVE